MRDSTRPTLNPLSASPMRLNSRGQLGTVEAVAGPHARSSSIEHPEFIDPLYHHPLYYLPNHHLHEVTVDVFFPDPEEADASVAMQDESECVGGILSTLARIFSSGIYVIQQQLTYSGDPTNAFEKSMMCPIRHEMMVDPVVDPDGHSYERQAIVKWLKHDNRSPITRMPMSEKDLRPNRALKAVIQQYIQIGGMDGLQKKTK